MRREIQNKNPHFTISEKPQEVYQFEKDGLELKSKYTAEDVKDKTISDSSPGIAPF